MSATTEERAAYLKMSRAVRGDIDSENDENEENVENITPAILSDEKYAEMGASEQFVLSVSNNGYGKRTSTFEYRVTGEEAKALLLW